MIATFEVSCGMSMSHNTLSVNNYSKRKYNIFFVTFNEPQILARAILTKEGASFTIRLFYAWIE